MSTDLQWFKSSHSTDEGGNCVEVATRPHTVHIRDSTNLTVPSLRISPAAWSAFLKYTEV